MAGNFIQMIQNLRERQELALHQDLVEVDIEELKQVESFLLLEYIKESQEYPFSAPGFDGKAALWAAKVIFNTAQYILFRTHEKHEMAQCLQPYEGVINSSAILSADLCLRFMPFLYNQLRQIGQEDELLGILKVILEKFHYSAIEMNENLPLPDMAEIVSDKCLLQLYVDRVIFFKNKFLAFHPDLAAIVKASLGFYSKGFWMDFELEND